MRRWTIALFAAALAASVAAPVAAIAPTPQIYRDPSPRIVGGSEVSPVGKYPFAVALVVPGTPDFQFCGGSLIAPSWVMTAAHCVTNNAGVQNKFPSGVKAIIGRHDLTTGDGVRHDVAAIAINPTWGTVPNAANFNNDIALIQLSTPSAATPIVLAEETDTGLWDDALNMNEDLGTVLGWGNLATAGPASDTLQEVNVPFQSAAECIIDWGDSPYFYPADDVCAGDTGFDSCVGDSGGPLIAPPGASGWKQVGIVSFGGAGCGDAHPIPVYTRVSAHLAWIAGTLGGNIPPIALDDAYSVDEDGTLITTAGVDGVADNDVDTEDGTPPGGIVSLATPPANQNGVFTLATDGSFTYDPVLDFNGVDSFTYTVTDSGSLISNVATVTIIVDPVNDAPSFAKGSDELVLEDAGPQTVPGWATSTSAGPADETGQTVSFLVSNDNNPLFATQPVVDATGALSFTPADDANGSATVSVAAKDDGGIANGGDDTGAPQVFMIIVDPVNDAPSFTKGSDELVLEDAGPQTVPGWATSTSAGPADETGQTVSFLVSNDNNPLFATQPAVDATGALTYAPTAAASGTATVTVTAIDDGGTANGGSDTSAPQFFAITVTAGPIANPDAYSVDEDGTLTTTAGIDGVADNDTDAEDGTPPGGAVTEFTPPANNDGVFTLNANGSFTYDPKPDFYGVDSFSYTIKDSGGLISNTATVTITVNAVNDPPSFTKGPDQTVLEDAVAQTVNPWANPSISVGPFEGGQVVSFLVTNDNNSLFAVQPAVAGTGILTYTPAANANGSATVTVTAKDDGGTANDGSDTSAPQAFTITVNPVNDEPSFIKGPDQVVPVNSARSIPGWATINAGHANESGQSLTFGLANDNNALFAVQPAIDASGTLTYTSAPSGTGTATVTVSVMDDGGTANGGDDTGASQMFTITVVSVPDTTGLADITAGIWYLRNSLGTVTSFFYGNPGDLPISGDWDGDGVSTPGLYRQSDGFFYARDSNTQGPADNECFAGDPSDIPLSGDWDGDGDDNLGIYRPTEQMFYLFTTTCTGTPMGAAQISLEFGNPGDKPVSGDWDGDGIDEIGLHRESTGLFYWKNDLVTGVADGQIIFGNPADRFVAGDWGIVDGVDTPTLFRPADMTFYFRHTLTQGNADSQFTWTGAGTGWLPVAGQFGLG